MAEALLSRTKLSEVLQRSQQVVTIKDTATVDQTLRVLATHRILSAPVVAPNGGEVAGHAVDVPVGFIDVRDILSSFLHEVDDLPSLQASKMLKKMRLLEETGQRFAAKPIKDLKSLGSDGWFYNLKAASAASLREIVHDGFLHPKAAGSHALFGGTRTRQVVHRLALFDAAGALTNVISQSDVVKYLHDHMAAFEGLAAQSVAALGLVQGTVISVRPDTPALDAMALMEEKAISAVAVVSARGGIIGNFSISEMRSIMAEHFGSLALPVGEFLALEHGTEYAGYAVQRDPSESDGQAAAAGGEGSDSPAPSAASFSFVADQGLRRRESHPGHEVGQQLICVPPTASLREVLARLVRHRLHRVYVVDADLAPLGVVTLTDLLRKFVGTEA